jgi:hypothetical protein
MRLIAAAYIYRRPHGSPLEFVHRISEYNPVSSPAIGQQGRVGPASGASGPRLAGVRVRRRTAELLQLGLDQRGELIDLRQRVGSA